MTSHDNTYYEYNLTLICGVSSLPPQVAAIFAGGKAAGIYPTDTVDQVEYKVVQSGASIVCLDDAAKIDKFAELVKTGRIPDVKAVVTWAAVPSRSQTAAFKKVQVSI